MHMKFHFCIPPLQLAIIWLRRLSLRNTPPYSSISRDPIKLCWWILYRDMHAPPLLLEVIINNPSPTMLHNYVWL